MRTILFFFLLVSFSLSAQKTDFKHINFKKADSIATIYKNETLKSLPMLSHLLTSKLETDVEKFRAIFIWVSKNIKGDHNAVTKNTRKRRKFKNDSIKLNSWNASFNKILFKKLLKNKKTVCTGYAYLIKELSALANIDCKMIDGYGRNSEVNIGKLSIPNHSWNAVKLNKKWYLVDATWASGYTDLNINTFISDYNDGYFLTAPSLFIKSHFPLDKKWMLLKKKTLSINKFLNAPLIYGKTYKHQIAPIFPKEMKNIISKNDEIIFQLYTNKKVNQTKIEIQISEKLLDKKVISRKKEVIFINYKFKIKGFYDVHILYKKDVIATYTFKVNK